MNELKHMYSIIEAALFVSGEPLELKDIAKAVERTEEETQHVISSLMELMEEEERGIHIIKVDTAYQICTNPKYFPNLEKVFNTPKRIKLSESLLETLAIVAYRQPITRNFINDIRGLNSDYNVNKLVEYNLIEEKGRDEGLGRPMLFGTTIEFLKFYGIDSIDKIPEISFEDLVVEANNELDEIQLSLLD
ncbi:MAG: SMC-Scp complex subunit ScpB [Lachnospirales bacterium]